MLWRCAGSYHMGVTLADSMMDLETVLQMAGSSAYLISGHISMKAGVSRGRSLVKDATSSRSQRVRVEIKAVLNDVKMNHTR